MEGTAATGSAIHIQLILNTIKSLGLEPNFQTYAFVIAGLERLGQQERVRNVAEEMEEKVSSSPSDISTMHLLSNDNVLPENTSHYDTDI